LPAGASGRQSENLCICDTHYVSHGGGRGSTFVRGQLYQLVGLRHRCPAQRFIYKGSSGRFYIGQVYESEHKDVRGETQRYAASVLLKGHSFAGLTTIGAFHEQEQITEMDPDRRQTVLPAAPGKTLFEQLAAKIEELDLQIQLPPPCGSEHSEIGTVRAPMELDWDRDGKA
jgi:hypothetical protein